MTNKKDGTAMVPADAYDEAVEERREFRNLYRKQKRRADRFAEALHQLLEEDAAIEEQGEHWLRGAIADAKRDLSMLPEVMQRIPPRSAILEKARR